jgi:hypothetical protein
MALNETIRRALESAGFPARLEPPGTSRDDGKRPDGMTLFPWRNGKLLVWDATCVDSLSPSHFEQTRRQPGSVVAEAERKKLRKYSCLSNNYIVTPVGFEALGRWGPDALSLLASIGDKIAERTFERRSTSYLHQRLSIAIQRGNAASVRGTIPQTKTLNEVYYL